MALTQAEQLQSKAVGLEFVLSFRGGFVKGAVLSKHSKVVHPNDERLFGMQLFWISGKSGVEGKKKK